MELHLARSLAEKIVEHLAPGCTRIEIAGGIRRLKKDPHDIEIICIPDLRPPKLVFGVHPFPSVFEAVISSLVISDEDGFHLVRVMGGDRYKKFGVSMDAGYHTLINLDLFIVRPPAQFGMLYLLRTGPEDFSHWIVTQKSRGGGLSDFMVVKDGAIHTAVNDEIIETPNESDVFDVLGLNWIEPSERVPSWRRNEHEKPMHFYRPNFNRPTP
jgi:DNA polymerase/3'-5' exonuclease PolX